MSRETSVGGCYAALDTLPGPSGGVLTSLPSGTRTAAQKGRAQGSTTLTVPCAHYVVLTKQRVDLSIQSESSQEEAADGPRCRCGALLVWTLGELHNGATWRFLACSECEPW